MFQLSFDKYLNEQFKPSIYQKQIFDWLENGTENSCVVGAVPGSGKTSTLIEGSKRISSNLNSQFLAFNKHIVQELVSKLPKYVKCSTIHSLGFSSVKRQYSKCKVVGTKYNNLCRQYLIDKNAFSKNNLDNLIDLVRLVKLTLTDYSDKFQLIHLTNNYSIDIKDNWDFWQEAIADLISIGIEQASYQVDFDDMIWLPNALNLSIPSSDFLFVDEAQDLNQAQLQLVLKAHHSQTRSLFVGDRFQSILGFAGADINSIDNIIDATNAIQLPLSISYRLPKSHVQLANKLYPVIEAAENAIEGVLERGKYDDVPEAASHGDLVICRCFYPLVHLYFALLKLGKPAQVKNHDISKQLISLLKLIFGEERFSESINRLDFNRECDRYFFLKRKELLDANENLMVVVLEDKIETVKAIYQGGKCQSINDCIYAINELSKPKTGNPVNLTTIHGAKGLEAKNVFLVRSDLLPHPLAKKPWELEQEKNLFFVGLTRSKYSLFIC